MPTRPIPTDFVLLGLAVAAVSTSAPLIRYATAPTLALAFWRNALALPVVAPLALWTRRGRSGPWLDRRERRLVAASGLLLAVHFATWVPSVSFTTIASSTALVATQPAWAALISRFRGHPVARGVWVGIGISFAGVLVLSGVDLTISTRALFGDLLAVVGGFFAAAYVTVGAEVRRTVDTTTYAAACYGVAAAGLLAICLVSRQDLSGYDQRTWLALAGLTIGPQLLGHTVLNRVLRTIDPTTVSVAILFEVVGAGVLAGLWFGETPPLAALPAGLLVLAGVTVVVRAGRPIARQGVPRG